jgi:predicted nucleic acid-binding protein
MACIDSICQPQAAIGPYDVLIAGQALARDLTLITHNVRKFQRAPASASRIGREVSGHAASAKLQISFSH